MKLRPVILLMSLLALSACRTEEDHEVIFIGDSLIEQWDTERSFPTLRSHNLGNPGKGISYVESLGSFGTGTDLVVLIGTNDMMALHSQTDCNSYAEHYSEVIAGLGGRRLHLVSILPCTLDYEQKHDVIKWCNRSIREQVAQMPHVVYLDLYSAFQNETEGIQAELTSDGLHLSQQGYRVLSQALYPYLQ